MAVIGLTGGIGSGKSAVSSYLSEKGCRVIDADKIAREVVEPGSPVLKELCRVFGAEIIEAGALNRRRLAEKAFADERSKAELDRITHGAILSKIETEIEAHREEAAVIIDAPLLFEAGLDRFCDAVWVVDADEGLRIKRVVERDGLTAEEVKARIRRQMPSEEKRKRADRVLENTGTLQELYRVCDQLLADVHR